MPNPSMSDEEVIRRLNLVRLHGSMNAAAANTGEDRAYFQRAKRKAAERGIAWDVDLPKEKPFEIDELPDHLPSAEEILDRRKADFAKYARSKDARKLVNVKVKIDGPYGIAHMGDPHVDDNGTDLAKLERHLNIINETDGLFGANVGDYSNNWIGRLARLYGEQSTSAAEAWVLVEWLIEAADWLYLIGGNHDCWSGAGDPIKWIARNTGAPYEAHGSRLNLISPNGKAVRVNARHDFKGHSQWNTAHGPSKAAQMGWRDHILSCGHLHTSGHNFLKDPSTGLISHAFRVAAYKTFDRYAEEKGLPDQNIFCCPVTVIDPQYADDDPRLVTFIPDPEEGADYLTFKRRKYEEGKRAA